MDKLIQLHSGIFCKRDNIPITNNQNEATDLKTKKTFVQPSIVVQKNDEPQETAIRSPCITTTHIKIQDGRIETLIEPLWPKENTLAKSSFLITQEIRMRTVVTAQDRFRLRVPEPRNAIEQVCRNCKFYYLHNPRPKKPLIVIDLNSLKLRCVEVPPTNEPSMLSMFEFLYRHFDIAIWSSHKMCNVIPKLETCGYFQKQNKFKINFILDTTSLTTKRFPIIGYCSVKDLNVIWNLYPKYNEHNSIMLNCNLKKIVYASYGVPINRKQEKMIDEVTMTILIEYLVDTINSTQSFAKLNIPVWKQFTK